VWAQLLGWGSVCGSCWQGRSEDLLGRTWWGLCSWLLLNRAQHSRRSDVRGLVGGPEIVDCACSGAGARASAYPVPWRFKYLSDERTERGTTVLVAGFDCYVVCNVFVVIVRSAIDGKWVVTSCVSLMDGSYQSYIGWRCGIICSGGSPSWIYMGGGGLLRATAHSTLMMG